MIITLTAKNQLTIPSKIAKIARFGRSIADNVLGQNFKVEKANKAWCSVISVFWTGSGWMHLAIVMDLFSRRIIGWAMKNRMTEELTISALNMAINSRGVADGLIHHSDQGSQYSSEQYQTILKARGIVRSMRRKGNCYDNAVVDGSPRACPGFLLFSRTYFYNSNFSCPESRPS
jgi:putative transposase